MSFGRLWNIAIIPDSLLRKDYYICLKCKNKLERRLK
jgi:hypothetical protein